MGIADGLSSTVAGMHSVLMAGQSNMAGRGDIGDVPPIDNGRCFMMRMGRWQQLSEPVNIDRHAVRGPIISGIGPAASFADAYAGYYGADIGLIPCADGGTEISQWMPGEVLFDHAVMMAGLAMRTSVLKGIIWHQGESDCTDREKLERYPERFIGMVAAMRRALGDPELPFVAGEISEEITPDFVVPELSVRFNAMLHELEQTIPAFTVVSAGGLKLKPDRLHFDARSAREFGLRYFEGLKRLL